ncbi:MAG: response regulator [Acidobacteriota bacterium]
MGYKILLADDSVTVQKIITLTFSDEGVDVLTVNNGDEALHRLQYLRPALVMADVSIPGKNGYEICEFVKNHPEMKDTPVVLLVPAFEPFDEERALRIGANQHLTKPFQSIRTLISTVKGLLESHPPKINTPMSGSLVSSSSLAKPAEEQKAKLDAVQPPRPISVQDTRPFPENSEEDSPLVFHEEAPEAVAASSPPEPASEPESVLEVEFESEPLAPAPAEPDEEIVEVIADETESLTIIEDIQPTEPAPAEEIPVVAAESQNGLVSDPDHVLDLDDVLPDIWPQPSPVPAAPVAETPEPVTAESTNDLHHLTQVAIPQTVIDEIVNRVVAQLSEKLTQRLAVQLAPEVVEIVKQQTQHQPVAQAVAGRDSGPLLELD